MSNRTWLGLRRGASLILCCTALIACESSTNIKGRVIEVQASPDGRATATLSKSEHGATVSDVYRVYLKDAESRTAFEVMRVDKAEGMNIGWSDARTLSVRMDCGKVFQFTNFFYIKDASGNPELISITLSAAGPCRGGA